MQFLQDADDANCDPDFSSQVACRAVDVILIRFLFNKNNFCLIAYIF